MPYAIVLYFDEQSESIIKGIWNSLAKVDISTDFYASGIRPHFTLGIYDELFCNPCENDLSTFAENTSNLNIQLSHIGLFYQPEIVLFLAPTPTKELLLLHTEIHDFLAQKTKNPWKMYQPDNWVPHCTLALDISPKQLNKAVSICAEINLPIKLMTTQIGAVELLPMKDLFKFNLNKY